MSLRLQPISNDGSASANVTLLSNARRADMVTQRAPEMIIELAGARKLTMPPHLESRWRSTKSVLCNIFLKSTKVDNLGCCLLSSRSEIEFLEAPNMSVIADLKSASEREIPSVYGNGARGHRFACMRREI
jgi:hypothetical protein